MVARTPLPDTGPVEYAPQDVTSPERQEAETALRHIPGVKGMGEGQDAIGDPAWVVYVQDKFVAAKLPRKVGGRTVVVEVTGDIDILPA